VKVFISYASADQATAEEVRYALRELGHEVFVGAGGLRRGDPFHQVLHKEVASSDLFVFLVSPSSVARRRYTLTELGYAKERWPDPFGHVLPVVLDHAALADADPYLRAVTVLEPVGNVAAEVARAVESLVAVPSCDVLFDAAHGQDLWHRQVPLLDGGFARAGELLVDELGIRVGALAEPGRLSRQTLAEPQVLVLPIAPEGRARLRPDEVDAVVDHVRRGGGLLALGTYTGDWHHEANLNEILEPFGILLENTSVVADGQSDRGHLFQADPGASHAFAALPTATGDSSSAALLAGIDRVTMLSACTVTPIEGAAAPLLAAPGVSVYRPRPTGRGVAIDGYDLLRDEVPPAVAAASRVARVVAVGSWKVFLGSFLDACPPNRRLLVNAVRWLMAGR
jgi:hypothetical protein